LDDFAHELLAARGSTYQNPPSNFYRAMRDPITRAESVGQVFLGVRLQCAKCHNHPFDRWTQDDYYDWASVFARVNYTIVENRRRDRNDKHEFNGEQFVVAALSGDVTNPQTDAPASPRFLGARSGPSAEDDRLQAVADWVASRDNPFFARAQVNRLWYHLMGRGIVDPIDDFRATNPPTHPALLEALSREFVSGGYRAKPILRLLMNSRTYQTSSEPNDTNIDDETNYSHNVLRPLSAEQLLDALHDVTGTKTKFAGYPEGLRAGQLPSVVYTRGGQGGAGVEERFLSQFGRPPRLLACECERTSESTLGRTFQLISGPMVQELLHRGGNRLDTLLKAMESDKSATDAKIVDELFWTVLGRAPCDDETPRFVAYLHDSKDRRQAAEDIAWSLVNAKEFLLRN
jgi:hypothetical protein